MDSVTHRYEQSKGNQPVSRTQLGQHAGAARIVPRYQFEARFKIELECFPQTLVTERWARDLSESGLGAFVVMHLLVRRAAGTPDSSAQWSGACHLSPGDQKPGNAVRFSVHNS